MPSAPATIAAWSSVPPRAVTIPQARGRVELGDRAGRELVGDDDPRLRGLARLAAEQLEQHPVRDVADVDRARPQVGVVHAVERGGDLVARVPERPRRRLAGRDRGARGRDDRVVVEQQRLRREDLALGPGHPRRGGRELRPRGVAARRRAARPRRRRRRARRGRTAAAWSSAPARARARARRSRPAGPCRGRGCGRRPAAGGRLADMPPGAGGAVGCAASSAPRAPAALARRVAASPRPRRARRRSCRRPARAARRAARSPAGRARRPPARRPARRAAAPGRSGCGRRSDPCRGSRCAARASRRARRRAR